MSSDTKLYDALGVSKSAGLDEIRKAYRKLALKYVQQFFDLRRTVVDPFLYIYLLFYYFYVGGSSNKFLRN